MAQAFIAAKESSDGWTAQAVEQDDRDGDDHNDNRVENAAQ